MLLVWYIISNKRQDRACLKLPTELSLQLKIGSPQKGILSNNLLVIYFVNIVFTYYCLCTDGDKKHKCLACGRGYYHKSHLTRHQRFECGQTVRQFPCPQCPYAAKLKEHLRAHLRFKHAY